MSNETEQLREALKELRDAANAYRLNPYSQGNLTSRHLAKVVARADALLASEGTSHTPTPGGFVPTPHEPVEGVTLWNTYRCNHDDDGAYIEIDGEPAGYVNGGRQREPWVESIKWEKSPHVYPRENSSDRFIAITLPLLAAFRDKVRAERARQSTPSQPAEPQEAERVAPVVEQKPLWKTGQWFKLTDGTGDRWFVGKDGDLRWTKDEAAGKNESPKNFVSFAAFEAAIASGELIPAAEQPAPAEPAGEKVNLNTEVSFELTAAGCEAWVGYQSRLPVNLRQPCPTKLTLWEFMAAFGPGMFMGCQVPTKGNSIRLATPATPPAVATPAPSTKGE